ncbi:MAG: hypothetical protein ACRC3J_09290 [Culicoidibacterales bacterium]
MYTSLHQLIKAGACRLGINKVICANDPAYDTNDYVKPRFRQIYMNFNIDKHQPILLSSIVDSNGSEDALWTLRALDINTRAVSLEIALELARTIFPTDNGDIIEQFHLLERFVKGEVEDSEFYDKCDKFEYQSYLKGYENTSGSAICRMTTTITSSRFHLECNEHSSYIASSVLHTLKYHNQQNHSKYDEIIKQVLQKHLTSEPVRVE